MNDSLNNPFWTAIACLVLIFLIAPVLVNIPISLTDTPYLALPKEGFSLTHYESLIRDRTWFQTALNSLFVASMTSIIATVLGTLCAFACWQLGGRIATVLRFVILTPLIVPTIVGALGFRRILVDLGLIDTFLGVILVYVVISLPFVFICVTSSLTLFDMRLLQASRSLGAGNLQSIRRVLIPSIYPGLLAGATLAFVSAWDELVILVFISGRAVLLLPRKMLQGVQGDLNPSLAAASSVLVLLTSLGVLFTLRYRKT